MGKLRIYIFCLVKRKLFNTGKKNTFSINCADALTMTENDWNEKYPGLVFLNTDYHYYKKLGKCKYNVEKDDSLGRL